MEGCLYISLWTFHPGGIDYLLSSNIPWSRGKVFNIQGEINKLQQVYYTQTLIRFFMHTKRKQKLSNSILGEKKTIRIQIDKIEKILSKKANICQNKYIEISFILHHPFWNIPKIHWLQNADLLKNFFPEFRINIGTIPSFALGAQITLPLFFFLILVPAGPSNPEGPN